MADETTWEKLVFYENMFYELDTNRNLFIDEKECGAHPNMEAMY